MKNRVLKVLVIVAVLVAAGIVVFIQENSSSKENELIKPSVTETVKTDATETAKANVTEVPKASVTEAAAEEKGELEVDFSMANGIEINADTLPENKAAVVNFYVDDTAMALLAVKDESGEIRVALDTCQVCNGSPKAYFEEINGMLECQNCSNKFTLDAVGSNATGCNPIKIDDAAITKTDNGIIVSGEYLAANAGLFANWKKL